MVYVAKSHVVWYGSQQESQDLVTAVARNCTCEFGMMGVRLATCAPHRMLTEDQRALDGLLFARHIAPQLWAEEMMADPGPDADWYVPPPTPEPPPEAPREQYC